MALFKPAWQKANNDEKALRFVEKCNVQEELKTIATEAPSAQVRIAATKKLRFEDDIAQVIMHNTNVDNIEFAKEAIARLSSPEVLKTLALTSEILEVSLTAIRKIKIDPEGERSLLEIAKARIDEEIGRTALSRVQKSAKWVRTAMTSKDVDFRMEAVRVPVADTVLCEIAMTDENEVICTAALVKIHDQKLLVQLVLENDNENVRLAAYSRITEQECFFAVAKDSENKSTAIPALSNVQDNDWLKELTASACLIDVRSDALGKLSAGAPEKEKLAFKIIPNYDKSPTQALKSFEPQNVSYLEGYEDVLQSVAMNADSLETAIEALCLLSKPENIRKSVVRINRISGADKCLPLVKSKLADEEAREIADKAIESALRRIRVEANELLAESIIRYNDFRLLDTVTDPWALRTIVERISSKPDAYDLCRSILRQSKNEAVLSAFNGILPELEEKKISKVRDTVLSDDYRLQERYDAAIELLHKFNISGEDDPELKDAYRELLNAKAIRTDRLMLELAKHGSDIDGVYDRLIAKADTLWELDALANYPTEQSISILSSILRTPGDPLRSVRASNALKAMYTKADSNAKADIELIPQQVYQEHYDVGGTNCHTDSPEVAFFLDD